MKAEEVAFRQATAISVISEPVKSDLVSRGVDARKILVNPNGADLDQLRARAGRTRNSRLRRTLGFGDDDCVVGLHRHLRLVARHRRAGGGHSAHLRRDAGREVPADRRRHPQAAARRRSRAPWSQRPGAPGRPGAAGRRRAAAEGVRHLRVAAQQPHGRQQVLRIADQDLRIHGDGRRHRRERPRADRRGAVAGAAAGRPGAAGR